MKTKDGKLMEASILIMTALPIGLTLLLTRAYFGRPEHLVRPLVGTAAGFLLLAAAASRLDDARWLTSELVRGLAFAALLVSALSIRLYFHRVPHHLSPRELHAGLACAAGFVAAVFWLRRK
jgi:hypothetical protein